MPYDSAGVAIIEGKNTSVPLRQGVLNSESSGIYRNTRSDYVQTFYDLYNRWQAETSFLSDPFAKLNHRDFLRLRKLAPFVRDFIIREIKEQPSFLVFALDLDAQEKPYNPDDVKDVESLCRAWVLKYDGAR